MKIDTGAVRAAVDGAGLGDLPAPGTGRTARRWGGLLELARTGDVSLARLAEADVDAAGILAEAGSSRSVHDVHGVWASAGDVQVHDDGNGGVRLTGPKPFCSGVGICTRALVTARAASGTVLVDADVLGVDVDEASWSTPALADTRTASVRFEGAPGVVVGGTDWYLDRAGFWHGAVGPAACWAGAAIGLVDLAEDLVDDDPHRLAHLGAMRSAEWLLRALLEAAGVATDRAPDDRLAAQWRARSVRHRTERLATEIADRFGRAFGPRPSVSDPEVARRRSDLELYLRQDHAERDLEALGRLQTPRGPGSGSAAEADTDPWW